MFGPRSDEAWEKYGVLDPYYGVYTDDKYRARNLDESTLAEFFRTGEEDAEYILGNIRRYLDAAFEPKRALEFGCGVGRITIPMARICPEVVGVDVADSMLEEARRNCGRNAVGNVDLVKSDDMLSRVSGRFDLVYSLIVFQHMSVRRGLAVFRELISRLDNGGVGVLHFTYARRAPAYRKAIHAARKYVPAFEGFVNLLRGRKFSYPAMMMNDYDLNKVFRALQENGCGNVHVLFDDQQGHLSAVLFFQKDARA